MLLLRKFVSCINAVMQLAIRYIIPFLFFIFEEMVQPTNQKLHLPSLRYASEFQGVIFLYFIDFGVIVCCIDI
jgi:hypothetical protein